VPKLRVHNFALSLDGYGAGPDQNVDNPLGSGGTRLHEWVFETRYGRRMMGRDGNDVRLGGGVATVQQYLRAGLIDEMHLAIVPILLGSGEHVFDHLDGGLAGYECVEFVSSPAVAHARLTRSAMA
jgi:hypothetical protein